MVQTVKQFTDPSDISGVLGDMTLGVAKLQTILLDVASAINNASGVTYTAVQVVRGLILRSGNAAVSDTLPTAASIVAAIPGAAVNDVFYFRVQNTGSGVVTLLVGTGVTLAGTTTITNATTRSYAVQLTNVTSGAEAVKVTGVSQAGN